MILILTQCFPSRIGGVENLISNLSLSLSNSEKIIVFADSHHLNNDIRPIHIYDKLNTNPYEYQLDLRTLNLTFAMIDKHQSLRNYLKDFPYKALYSNNVWGSLKQDHD